MYITVKSFNDNLINDGSNYQTAGLTFRTPPAATLSFIVEANADPIDSGLFTGGVRNVPLTIRIMNYGNRWALDKQLQTWFKRGTRGLLVATFADDGLDYQLDCRVVSLTPEDGYVNVYNAVLSSGNSSWKAVTPQTQSWTATDVNTTQAITVNGAEETRLIASITPSAAGATGWQYQYLYQLINKAGINYGTRPWCITLNTATLVTASQLRADCYDLRIMVNGKEVNRWISGADSTTTKVWFNLTIGSGYSLTLKTAIAGSGSITEIDFDPANKNNLAALKAMPASGMLVDGTEWFQYTGIDTKNCKVTVKARGALGTTEQAHSPGVTFQYIQNVIYLLAGNADATDPAAVDANYNDSEPVFDLGQSDNTAWVYSTSSLFYDITNPSRPGCWTPAIKASGDISEIYEISEDAGSGAPALGMLMANYQKGVTWEKEAAVISWSLNCPGGISQVSATGSKYCNTSCWPGTAALECSSDGKKWKSLWTEASPSTLSTWTAISNAGQAVSGNVPYIEFLFSNTLPAGIGALCYFEILTCTVTFYSTNLPAGTMLGQEANYPLNIKLTNQANGDFITLSLPMVPGRSLIIDGENSLLTTDGVNVYSAMDLNDPGRDIWIRLEPGANTLEIDPLKAGDSIGTLALALSWYARQP